MVLVNNWNHSKLRSPIVFCWKAILKSLWDHCLVLKSNKKLIGITALKCCKKQNIPATQKERLLALEWSALHYFLLGSHITHIISIKAPQPWAWGKDHFKYCVATFSHPEWMTRCWPKGLFHGKPSQKTNKWEDLPFPFGKMLKWWKAAPRMLELKATRPPENLSYNFGQKFMFIYMLKYCVCICWTCKSYNQICMIDDIYIYRGSTTLNKTKTTRFFFTAQWLQCFDLTLEITTQLFTKPSYTVGNIWWNYVVNTVELPLKHPFATYCIRDKINLSSARCSGISLDLRNS